jgi:hypothetical protein
MQCREVRELADSFLSEQLLVETNHEVLRHLEGCLGCRSEMASRRALRATIQRAFTNAESLRIRDEFRASTVSRLRAIAFPRTRRPFFRLWRQVAAAIVLMAATGIGLFLLSGRAGATARDAAGDHRVCAILSQLGEKPISLEDAATRYDASFGLLQNTPADETTSPEGLMRVVRRHSCQFHGTRFAHIILQFHGQLVSLLMTGDDGQMIESGDGADSPPHLAWLSPIGGFTVVSFKTPGHIIFLVSSIEKPELSQVAQFLADPVYRRLAGK